MDKFVQADHGEKARHVVRPVRKPVSVEEHRPVGAAEAKEIRREDIKPFCQQRDDMLPTGCRITSSGAIVEKHDRNGRRIARLEIVGQEAIDPELPALDHACVR